MKKYYVELGDFDANKISFTSLVNDPAMESMFVKLSKEEQKIKLSSDEKRIITGVALIPEKEIYRNINGEEFNIAFTKESILDYAQTLFKANKQDAVNIEHDEAVEDVYIFESWIVEDSDIDKSVALGLGKQEPGTLCLSMKVDNDEVWQKAKDGELNGFSIEALLVKEIVLSKQNKELLEIVTQLNETDDKHLKTFENDINEILDLIK